MAGLKVPGGLDGQSLWLGLTGGPAIEPRKPMVYVFPEYGGQVAVNLGRYKLVRTGLKTKNPGPWELYDLENDPSEASNIATREPVILAKAQAVLAQQNSANPLFPVVVPRD